MSKTVKVSDETHAALEDLRKKRETLGEAVARLIRVARLTDQTLEELRSNTQTEEVHQ